MPGLFFAAANISRSLPSQHSDYLYWSDGTAAGTRDLGLVGVQSITALGNSAVVISRENGVSHLMVFSEDGTKSTDIYSAANNATINLVASINGRLYFNAAPSTAAGTTVLWSTDGTVAGTVKVNLQLPANESAFYASGAFEAQGSTYIVNPTYVSGSIQLRGNDGAASIYRLNANGTSTKIVDTVDVKDNAAAVPGGFVYEGYAFQTGLELYFSNGTPGNANLIADIGAYDASGLGRSSHLISFNGKALFTATGSRGAALYSTDGTTQGTGLLLDNKGNLIPNAETKVTFNTASTLTGAATYIDGKLLVAGYSNIAVTGYQYWLTDGTQAGTSQLLPYVGNTQLYFNTAPVSLTYGHVLADAYYFNGSNLYFSLYDIDIATGASVKLADLNTQRVSSGPYVRNFDELSQLTSFGDHKVVFRGSDYIDFNGTQDNIELWYSNGSAVGTGYVDIVPGKTGSYLSYLTAVGYTPVGRAFVDADFSGDGHSDLLFRNVSGAVSTWNVSGDGRQVQQAAFNASVDSSWKIAEFFDRNGDGRADILFRNDNGAVAVWDASGSGFDQAGYYHAPVPTSWRIAGTGDLNGDGKDDLLWQNSNGAISAWTSTGATFQENTYFRGSAGSGWLIEGLGDFNGDDRADILWRNSNGAVAMWTNNGAGTSFNESAFFQGGVATSWHVDGIGDFNGDGRDDILWRNDNGAVSVWRSNGSSFDQAVYNANVATSWHIAEVGDLNGDGRADIVWRNDDGAVSTWQSNGAGFDQSIYNGSASTAWSLASHDFVL